MQKFLDYNFLGYLMTEGDPEFIFGPINVIILIVLAYLVKFTLRFVRKYLRSFLEDRQIKFEKKELSLYKLAKQIIYILAIIIGIQSFSINNDNLQIGKILEVSIIDLDSFKFKFYHIFFFAFLVIIGRIAIGIIRVLIRKAIREKHWIDQGTEYVLTKLSKYVIYVITIFVGIKSIGVDLSILMASSAALFVGFGLGMQSIFTDIVSGFILLFEGIVKVGDIVEVDGMIAVVKVINIRTSKVETRDGNFIIVPNSILTQQKVTNWTHSKKVTRFRITVGVAYGSDTHQVRDILKAAASSHPEVMTTKGILVRFEDFGDSALIFELFFWADKSWENAIIKSDIRFEIDRLFRKHSVEIPFPQQDIHLKSVSKQIKNFGKSDEEPLES